MIIWPAVAVMTSLGVLSSAVGADYLRSRGGGCCCFEWSLLVLIARGLESIDLELKVVQLILQTYLHVFDKDCRKLMSLDELAGFVNLGEGARCVERGEGENNTEWVLGLRWIFFRDSGGREGFDESFEHSTC
ncbi:hypothetical protein BLNAU_16110 [Blattamonas nauphoetae]|uniref:EF-hand domain-containing protein n=1 Tax=Blattamonas nauphoetae TaxID=2049346 RepID=A0ABQ9XC88_9EUKA|nr:hypothetical protein BLNAU_16110 [Blattamonas nauphoetae]